jgi:hypothetical protein
MKILTTSTSNQTIKVVPREYVTTASLVLRDDTTNTETTDSVTPTTIGDYLQIENADTLKESRFYDLTLKNSGGSVIYKDKVFCTDQTVDQSTNNYYSVNDSVYTTDTTYDDDYILL